MLKCFVVNDFRKILIIFLKFELLAFILHAEGWQSGRMRRS